MIITFSATAAHKNIKLRLRQPTMSIRSYDSIDERSPQSNNSRKACHWNSSAMIIRRLLSLTTIILLSSFPTLSAAAAIAAPAGTKSADYSSNNHKIIQTNKRMVSYAMLDSLGPLDSYVYSFYPPSASSVVPSGSDSIVPAEFAELFRPNKRDTSHSGKRSSDGDIPGVLRFGKRLSEPEPLMGNPAGVLRFGKRFAEPEPLMMGNPAGVLRFGKRDDMPGVLRFGKRQVPGVLRFGKRGGGMEGGDEMPGVLRFGKREMSMPSGVLRFGKKSDDMPGVLRFGRK